MKKIKLNSQQKAFSFFLILIIVFVIGLFLGSSYTINKCIQVAEKLLDIKFKTWVIPEITSRIGGINWYE